MGAPVPIPERSSVAAAAASLCRGLSNPDQADGDGDGIGDAADNAPNVSNPDQKDTDSDGIGDVIDSNAVTIGTLSGKTLANFSDASGIATWAKDVMTARVKAGTVTGSDGKLNPTGTTTRAEMAQVLYALLMK